MDSDCPSRMAGDSTHGGAHGISSSIGNVNHGSARRSSTWSMTIPRRGHEDHSWTLGRSHMMLLTKRGSCPPPSPIAGPSSCTLSALETSQAQRHGHDHCCVPPVCCFVGFAGAGTRRLDTAGCWFGVRPVKPRSMVSGFVVVGLLDAFVQDV